jgi:hypothetical protein
MEGNNGAVVFSDNEDGDGQDSEWEEEEEEAEQEQEQQRAAGRKRKRPQSGRRAKRAKMSRSGHYRILAKLYKELKICCVKKTHAGRRVGARLLRSRGWVSTLQVRHASAVVFLSSIANAWHRLPQSNDTIKCTTHPLPSTA